MAADAGQVALQRGPLLYCLEQVDNGPHLGDLVLPRNARLGAKFDPKLLGGVVRIRGRARRVDRPGGKRELYRFAGSRTKPVTLEAVPYCVWDNRRPGAMRVWIREA